MFEHTKAAYLRPDVDSGALTILDDAAVAMGPGIAEAVSDAMRALDGVTLDAIEAAIEASTAAPILETTAWSDYVRLLESIYGEGSIVEIGMDSTMDAVAEADLNAVLSPAGKAQRIRAFRQAGSQSVAQVVEGSTRAAERAVQNANGPRSIRAAARELLRRKSFKLSDRGAATLQKYIVGLTEGDARLEMTPSQIQQAIDRRFDQLRRDRALLITQAQTYQAVSQSQTDAWALGVEQGELDPARWWQEWLARVLGACPLCRALDEIRAPLPDGVFVSRPIASGPKAGQIIRFSSPLVHPRCYCGRRLVSVEGKTWVFLGLNTPATKSLSTCHCGASHGH
ncbi:MAG: hypothetical protein AAFV77_06545 [Planctomycetota bacterium]